MSKRSLLVTVSTTTVLAATAAAGWVLYGSAGAHNARTLKEEANATRQQVAIHAGTSAGSPRSPHYLPAGASPAGAHVVGSNITFAAWTLPGAANQWHLTDNADSHAGAELDFVDEPVGPGYVYGVPPTDEVDSYAPTTINGHPGYIETPVSGYGTYKVVWFDGTDLYTVMCTRAQVGNAPNGVGTDELIKVATSVS